MTTIMFTCAGYRIRKILLFLIVSFCVSFSLNAGPGEQLIVFIQKTDSTIENHFQKNLLPEIVTIARGLDVAVTIEDGKRGVPSEVCITPLIVYQNQLGRSIYQGRTTTLKRIKNFIRTSRRLPQGSKKLISQNIAVQAIGKSLIWSPVKVSPVSGTLPAGYDEASFIASSRKAIEKGFKKFHVEKEGVFGRCDRGFYMDFYPWCASDGTLYLSLALFSQFHCKKPVFQLEGEKLTGSWKDRSDLFRKAAVIMEEAVEKAVNDPLGGDGFDPVSSSVAVTDWDHLGYTLPQPVEKKGKVSATNIVLPNSWTIPPKHPEGFAAVQFRFPAPLDNYLGEAQTLSGSVLFPEDNSIAGMTGSLFVDTSSITMGESDLDKAIKGALFLDTETYPKASFQIKNVDNNDTLEFGRLAIASIAGIFQLKGKEIPLSLPITLEPVIDEHGKPSLIITGSFSIDVRDFDIEGATGPKPEKYILLFDLNLALSPK